MTFDPTIVTHHEVIYGSDGEKEITVAIESGGNNIYTSRSILIVGGVIRPRADAILDFPGIRANFYNGCNADVNSAKTVIYLSGIDVMDFIPSQNRDAAQIYAEMLQNDRVIQLKNDGYNFLVVDWRNSRIDMRFNALYLVNLIQELKCNASDNHQFVIMGESMGGVIGRYALTYMETEAYQNQDISPFFVDAADINNAPYLLTNMDIFNLPNNWCQQDRMHNTRLLITIDAPHQGANVPLSVQHAYRSSMNVFGRYIGTGLKLVAQAFNLFLDGQAAQQLLIYHIDTKSGPGFNYNYSSHPDKEGIFNQLMQMGNYPQFAKVVAMSNGALNGEGQLNFYTSQQRVANDKLIELHTDLYARVLWLKVPVFGGDLVARTNPDGNGQVFNAQAGFYGIRIKLRWFGIKISFGYNSLLYKDESVNSLPYCVNAGGYVSGPRIVSNQPFSHSFNLSENYWLFNLFGYHSQNDGRGCATFKTHLGLNGFASANFDFSLCSDGTNFCFIPVQSALDYGTLGSLPLDLNLEQVNINTKLATVADAVDVMIGYPEGLPDFRTGSRNYQHVNMRNDLILNLDQSSSLYFSCIPSGNETRRGILNLEIGDEELYLENVTLPWNADYQTEYDIHVNARNPYYEYPSGFTQLRLDGIYSKENDYIIAGNAQATFIHDGFGSPTGFGLQYNAPFTGTFNEFNQPLLICCQDYRGSRLSNLVTKKSQRKKSDTYLKLFPNPNPGNQLMVKFKLQYAGRASMDILNINGQRKFQKHFDIDKVQAETTAAVDIRSASLTPGIYIVRLYNNREIKTAKLVIAK